MAAVTTVTILTCSTFVLPNLPDRLRVSSAVSSRQRSRQQRASLAAHEKLLDPQVQRFIDRHVVNEEELMSEKTFPIPPDELITLTKVFLATEAPEADPPGDGTMLTDDFQFVGPVIGPLDKEDFLSTVPLIDFFRVMPDGTAQFHHFRVDPFEPDRVWYTARGTGTNTGRGEPGTNTEIQFGEPTGKKYINPPQACSVKFTEDGKVKQFTIGYVMDRYIGNTGGMGGFFGPLYAIGKSFPFPEGQPWQPSLAYQAFVRVNSFLFRLKCQYIDKEERVWDGITMPRGTDEPL